MKYKLFLILLVSQCMVAQSYHFDMLFETKDKNGWFDVFLVNSKDSTYYVHIFKSIDGALAEIIDYDKSIYHFYEVTELNKLKFNYLYSRKNKSMNAKKNDYINIIIDTLSVKNNQNNIEKKITVNFIAKKRPKDNNAKIEFTFGANSGNYFNNYFYFRRFINDNHEKHLGEYQYKMPDMVTIQDDRRHVRSYILTKPTVIDINIEIKPIDIIVKE